jgi:hypothetical protein
MALALFLERSSAMMHRFSSPARGMRTLSLAIAVLALSACGGAESGSPLSAAAEQAAAGSVQTLAMTLPATTAGLQAQPQFHVAPVVLAEPEHLDAADPAASAVIGPHLQTVTAELSRLSTRRLTQAAIESVLRDGIVPADVDADSPGATPLSTGTVVATYTPAQIRAAYGLPSLPAAGTTLTSLQAAQLGAGQTIYIIDAQDDPNSAAELAAFSQNFGLPACSTASIAPGAALPLPAAPAGGCSFAVVYSTASGAMTASAPAYNSGWATEIALDVQWTHATAPLARIILIEAPDTSIGSLTAAVSLANAMGPGVVSMSFASPEGSWTASVDATFTGTAMTYVAGAGDSGAAVNWPAVSSHVLAVGGSTLTYTGTSPRSEVVWSGTGGGISQYTPAPAYQTSAVPGMGTPANREVSDVTFNADPTTGQYIAVLAPGAATASWLSAGGTSLSTPQWAGIIAVANALRAQTSQAPLGDPHAPLYALASQGASYGSDFYDITQGSDGTCAGCYAEIGYDLPSGVGTPNVSSLLSALDPAPAPVVPAASISGTAGTPLSFTVTVNTSDALTFALSNAPAGMNINGSGVVSWAAPVSGTFAVAVSARDNVTGLTGQGVYTVTIQAAQPPAVASASISGSAGVALLYTVSVRDPNPVTFTLSGAPSGMTISTAGVLGWPTPVIGTHTVTVTAHDAKTGLSGQGVLAIHIAAPKAPTVTPANIHATVGKTLSFTVSVSAPDPVTFALSGAPAGMAISSSGVLTWPSPTAGTHGVTVSARDTKTGLTGSAVCTVTVTPAGPVITAGALTGVAGKALSGTIGFADGTSNKLNIAISGAPAGMTFAQSGASLAVHWASPIAGSYKLSVSARDGNGLTASLSVPVTITAH